MSTHVRNVVQSLMGGVVICASLSLSLAGEMGKSSTSKTNAQFQNLALKQFDADGNGALNAAEKRVMNRALSSKEVSTSTSASRELQAQARQQFDANGNGALDRDEIRAAVRSVSSVSVATSLNAARRQVAGPGPSSEIKPSMRMAGGSFLQRFDANGDGVLDQSEMAAAEGALIQIMQRASGSQNAGMPFTAGFGTGGNGSNGLMPGAGNPLAAEGAAGCTTDDTESGTTTAAGATANSAPNAARGLGRGQRFGGSSGGFVRGAGGRGFGGGAISGRRGR